MPANKETEKQFQQRTFPSKIANAKRHAKRTLSKLSNSSDEEKTKARKVLQAVGSLERRMRLGKAPTADAPKKKGRVADIPKLSRLPGGLRKRLKGIEEQTGKAVKGK